MEPRAYGSYPRSYEASDLPVCAALDISEVHDGAKVTPTAMDTDMNGRRVLVVVRGYHYREDLAALRPYIREYKPTLVAVDGGADALLEVGYRPDAIFGDMDSVTSETRALRPPGGDEHPGARHGPGPHGPQPARQGRCDPPGSRADSARSGQPDRRQALRVVPAEVAGAEREIEFRRVTRSACDDQARFLAAGKW